MSEILDTQEIQRDVEQVHKPNLDALSSDSFLNGHTAIEPAEEVKPIVENPKLEEGGEDILSIEKPIDEAKPNEIVEETKEETTELSLDETEVLTLDEQSTEPQEGTWLHVAKEAGIEGVSEDSFESVRDALIKPYVEELENFKTKKVEDYLIDIDPALRMRIELNKTGMSFEDIERPYKLAAEYKGMEPAALVRAELESVHPNAKPEWIDAEMERLASTDGAIDHERERILMQVEDQMSLIDKERSELVEKYKVNRENVISQRSKESVESVVKALNEIPDLMGTPIAPETKRLLADNMNNGKYDHIFDDPALKAEFIAYSQLKASMKKAQEAAVAKSYAKGKLDITKELHNTPPLDRGGAGAQVVNIDTKGTLKGLESDPYLEGRK